MTRLLPLAITASTASLLGLLGGLLPAHAVTFNSSGTWINPTGGGTTIEYPKEVNENQIRWGTGDTSQKSGLGFAGVSSSSLTLDTPFLVGTLRHFNYPVFPPTVSAVDLLINLDFSDVGGTALSKAFTFGFGIDETNNIPPCVYPSTVDCADKVAFFNTTPTESFSIASTTYTLKLLGFSSTLLSGPPTDTLLTSFISQERTTSTAYLYGKITVVAPPTPVPEPGAIAPLALLGLYFTIRRSPRKAKN